MCRHPRTDGDGADVAFFPVHRHRHILLGHVDAFATIAWGGPGRRTESGRFSDGDGRADIVFFPPSTGTLHLCNSATSTLRLPVGGPGDIPALKRP
jgi:hypothetical protein